MKIAILVITAIAFLMIISVFPVHASSVNPDTVAPPEVSVTSRIGHEILSLPENSSNLDMFYEFNITIFSPQAFTISVNGNTVSSGSGPISISENMSKYSEVNMTVRIGSTPYSYSHISIIGVPPRVGIENVIVTTTYPGQDQTLAVKQGVSGQLTYPEWSIILESSSNETYSIYEDGLLVDSGHVLGSKTIDLNVTGNTTSIIVGMGTHVFNFKHEMVAHEPVSQYYKAKPPELVATALDVALSFARGMIIVFLAFVSGLFLARPWVVARKESEPQRRF
jgi:hypothetical protein